MTTQQLFDLLTQQMNAGATRMAKRTARELVDKMNATGEKPTGPRVSLKNSDGWSALIDLVTEINGRL